MPNINTPESGHVGQEASTSWQYLPYSDVALLATLQSAIHIIDSRIKGYKPCDQAFKALPGGRTFSLVWADPSVWINYDPGTAGGRYGATRDGSKNITISNFALRMGRWTTAATIVHELAHVNGAPSGNSHAAEGTLRSCLLQGLEDPNILGVIQRASRSDFLA